MPFAKYVIAIAASLLLLASSSCRKGGCQVFQTVPFQYIASYTQYGSLSVPGGYAETEQGGVSGLIIVHTANGIRAYDRRSTVNPEQGCRVNVEEGGQTAIDPCSQARYVLTNGAPASVAECPLREYSVSYQQNGVLISN
ncbi:hypothetical protein [Olivibacter sitiensis]|uniref:hypothetical protein n=1 Tax=Olivibacter sitiensis TaxID=376470 RepID=UPI00040995B2|nr:hypothetical protein [Olivibacter sitiensis]